MFKYYGIFALFVLFTVTACGQSGALYLPKHHKEAASHVDQ